MTEPDPGATFRQDQEAAATEASTREQFAWDNMVNTCAADLAAKRAITAHYAARARLWRLLGTGVIWVIVLGFITWLAWMDVWV